MKKKRKKTTINKARVLAVLLIIIAIIAAIIFIFRSVGEENPQSKPVSTVSTYMSYINDAKYEEMYELLDSSSKNNVTKEEFIAKNETIYSQLQASGIKVSDVKEGETENRKSKGYFFNTDANNSGRTKLCKYCKTC